MSLEPTEDVDLSRITTPYLKRNFINDSMTEDERLESFRNADRISVNVSPATYTLKFIASEPTGTGGIQYCVQSDKIRSGASEEFPNPEEFCKQLKEKRNERMQELFIRNAKWMRDLSRDDVDARKAAFKKDLEEPKAGQLVDGADVDMADS